MARLNFRLTCSLLTVGIVALLAVLPGTRTVVQRQLWILTGQYEKRMLPDKGMFFATNGLQNDDRILTLLMGYNQVPVESRAIEMMKVAASRKDPALWAHTVRQATFVPVPTSNSRANYNVADRIRMETIGRIQLVAAEEGAKLDPDNVFFDLAKATALAKLGQWEKVAPVLIEAGKRKKYDDYIFDEFKRRIAGLRKQLNPVLDSDLGGVWTEILIPHLANFKSLTRGFDSIPDPRDRLAAALGLARAGKLMENQDSSITRISGSSLILRSAYDATGLEYKTTNRDLAPALRAVVARAEALGDKETAAGWRAFEGWKLVVPATNEDSAVPQTSHEMSGVYGLYLLIAFAAIAAAVWLGGHVEPSASNVATLSCILMGAEIFACLSVERSGLLFAMLLAGNLAFASFLLIRLPGKAKLGWMLAVAALVVVGVADLLGQLFLGFVLIWGIPFAWSRWVRPAAPRWVGIVLATLFFGFGFFYLFGSFDDPTSFNQHMIESIAAMLALTAFWVPVLVAVVMSVTKTNLSEALKQIAVPLPLATLAAAATFAWGTREMLQWEKAWQEIAKEELPEKYQQVLLEAKSNEDE